MFEKCIIISDSHGYADLLGRLLAEVGIVDGVIPPHIQLIHLGDAVDRGPDSPRVFNMLRKLQRDHPDGQVVRLVGNHEHRLCGGPRFPVSRADEEDVSPLAPLMYEDGKSGKLSFAYALSAGGKDWLCVHGGLDPRQSLAKTGLSAAALAERINRLGVDFFHLPEVIRNRDLSSEQLRVYRESHVLTGVSRTRGGYDLTSGITWCDVVDELVPFQDEIKIPQIVGHRAHPEITFYPGGKLVAVNVPYGQAQALIVDLQTGEMSTTALLDE